MDKILSALRIVLGLIRPEYQRRFMRDNVKAHRTAKFFNRHRIRLGRYVYIGPNCVLNGEGEIFIGDGAILAPNVIILSSTHDYKSGDLLPFDIFDLHRPVSIGRGVWIGYGAMISPGVRIGDGAVVAMGSVVVSDVEKGGIVGGNPARSIGRRIDAELDAMLLKEAYFIRKYWKGPRPRVRAPVQHAK